MDGNMDGNMIFRIVLIVVAAFGLFALVSYYNSKQNVVKAEKFYEDTLQSAIPLKTSSSPAPKPVVISPPAPQPSTPSHITAIPQNTVQPSEEQATSMSRPLDYNAQKLPSDCFPKDRLTPEDLLPQDAANSKWAQVNPAGQGDVRDQNFLTAGALVGIDTVGSSLRNASYDLRSEMPNPRGVWPIMNSTIEPNLFRKSLEIGSDC